MAVFVTQWGIIAVPIALAVTASIEALVLAAVGTKTAAAFKLEGE
jgi:hypothetical protein